MTAARTRLATPQHRAFNAASPASPASVPDDFPMPHPTTGTEDDDDDPSEERAGENEAPGHAMNERTEAPEEFGLDDERSSGRRDDDGDEKDDSGD